MSRRVVVLGGGPIGIETAVLAKMRGFTATVIEQAEENPGADVLGSPETDFWVVGSKSYGRNSNFLLRVGFEQIEAIVPS